MGLALALLVMERVPATLPDAAAENSTVKLWLWLAASVMGSVKPDTLKPAPVTVTLLTLTLTVPVLEMVTVCEPMVPTVVLTEMLLGETES
jgi:hypothetical protein